MAISKDLERLILKKISARRQPWWRLEEFGPPNLECVPTPLGVIFPFVHGMTFNQGILLQVFYTSQDFSSYIWKSVIEYIQSVMYYIIYIIWSTCYCMNIFFPFNFQILKYVI
jgi:hypothetical protein